MNTTLYTCAQCGAAAEVADGKVIRSCAHEGEAVKANLSATVYGEAALNRDESDAGPQSQ